MNALFLELAVGLVWVAAAWAAPGNWFKALSVAAALTLFALIDPWSAVLLFGVTLGGWAAIRSSASRSRLALASGIAGLGILFGFKWFSDWLPFGISYFIFRQISYQIEVYKGELPPHKFSDLLAYQFLPPVLLVGPIHRFTPFLVDLRRRRWDTGLFTSGLEKVILGLFHLAFVGNYLLSLRVPKWIEGLPVLQWHYLESVRFAFNTYFQFAGYSEVAVGLSAMAGLRVMDNFNRPFLAQNISDFWQRWHISLSSWCRDSVYFPVVASTRNVGIGLLLSLGLLSMWHETNINYALWGLLHVAATLVFRWWTKRGGVDWLRQIHPATQYIGHLLTFHFVVFSFTLIRSSGWAPIVAFWSPVWQSLFP